MIFSKHINRYYLRYAPLLLLGLFALVVVDYAQLEIPELYRMVINGVNNGFVGEEVFDLHFLLEKICLPLIFVILLIVIGRFTWRVTFFGAGVRVETDLRRRMFDRARTLSASFYQTNKVGNLMSLFTNDIETVQECFGWGVMMFFDALTLGVFAVVKMWMMNPILTLLSMIPMVFLCAVGALLDRAMKKKWDARQAAYSAISDHAQESFSGISVIKAFVTEIKEVHAFRRLNKQNEETNVAYTRISIMLDIFITLFVESVVCVILGYGGYLVWRGVFDAGLLVEFIGYFTAIVWPIMAISQMIQMHSRGAASMKRIGELLDAEPEVKDAPGILAPSSSDGSIEAKGLTFRYPGANYDALSDVTFRIEAGERVGITGKTGAGKTTLADLILRTYNVPDGTLFVGGHDVNTVPIRSVRDLCAYVPQDNFLFSDTIENNIAFAVDAPDRADVADAARRADVDDNISAFPLGYGTVLGERGVTVSGGQKQRISIARALMKDSEILILDDSVSAVDTATERIILDNLKRIHADTTLLLIAHRISTIEQMDKIIYMDDGRVVAVGSHEELMSGCEEYRRAVELQKLEEGGDGNV